MWCRGWRREKRDLSRYDRRRIRESDSGMDGWGMSCLSLSLSLSRSSLSISANPFRRGTRAAARPCRDRVLLPYLLFLGTASVPGQHTTADLSPMPRPSQTTSPENNREPEQWTWISVAKVAAHLMVGNNREPIVRVGSGEACGRPHARGGSSAR